MVDTSDAGIEKLINKGKSKTVELASGLPADYRLAQILTAFANTEGGVLIIGAPGWGGLSGESGDVTMQRLKRIASSLFPWPIEINYAHVFNGARGVIYAVVDKAPRHYFPLMTSRGEVFVRKGTKILRATSLESVRENSARKTAPCMAGREVTIFVAMSFREEEEPALVDYFRAMQNAAKETMLPITVKRVDVIEGDYEISQRIMEEIDKAQIVLVDFTLNSRNVYFELGYARGVGKRIIQATRKGTSLEFDIRNWRTIFYRNATELEEKLMPELKSAYQEVGSEGS